MIRCIVSLAFPCLIVALLGLSGCSVRAQSPPTQLYVLTALPRAESTLSVMAASGVAIGVGPVGLPQYVNRPQIVTGDTSTELQRAAFAQWAEPLEDNFTRVLAENLSGLLHTDRVAIFPWKGPLPIDYQIVVEVTRFLGETGGNVSLVALWSVISKDGREVLVSQRSSFSKPTGAAGYEALAAALSRTVAALSRDIADAITTLSQQKNTPERERE